MKNKKARAPKKRKPTNYRPIRARLIFNPGSGAPGESPLQLVNILLEMQRNNILPEVYILETDSPVKDVVSKAIQSGIKLIVVAGGDGTIGSVLEHMVGKDVILGVIPTGTRNNVAFNLGIPGDIAESVALLRHGRRMKIDVGRVHRGRTRRWFLEGVALGVVSDLYPMADEFQHGDLAQIGGLLSTILSSTPSQLRINMDGRKHLVATAYLMMVTNMPFLGPHFQISPRVSFKDGLLDVFTFSDMTKLNLFLYAMLSRGGLVEDEGIKHFRARDINIISKPEMSVLADGVQLGGGSLSVHIYPRAITVMTGTAVTGKNTP
ncbi:MAG: hypothetical protein EPO32_02070 [Anaerolineae bacterium]|nr:MAG: hypothetical protein EPO32_02070 [Anaerolineae bacterium]